MEKQERHGRTGRERERSATSKRQSMSEMESASKKRNCVRQQMRKTKKGNKTHELRGRKTMTTASKKKHT